MSKDKKPQSTKQNTNAADKAKAVADAKSLLASPYLFRELITAVQKAGLVGETRNALVLYVASTSRLLPRPLNVFVKGQSSSGKNWLVSRTLLLLPPKRVREISNASQQAWIYAKDYFRNKVIFVQERSEVAGNMLPLRLFISEGKLVRMVTKWINGQRRVEKHTARGPVAVITTTTQNTLQIDDETRHISILVDESTEQTKRIIVAYTKPALGLSAGELRAWHEVQRLLEERMAE